MARHYEFKVGSLPKAVYDLLKQIAQSEDMTQRAVVVAGTLALHRMRTVAPEHLTDVLTEAKQLAPRRSNVGPVPAP